MPFCVLLLLAQYVPTDFKAELFGGTYRALRRPRFALTGRIVAGLTDWNRVPTQTAFTFGFAQSIDWKFNENWALRAQPGFRFLRLEDPGGGRRTVLATPLAIGVVYKFGNR